MSGLGTRVASAALRLMRLSGKKHVRERHALALASKRLRDGERRDAGPSPRLDSPSIYPVVPSRQQEERDAQRTAQYRGGTHGQDGHPDCHLRVWRDQCSAIAKAAIKASGLSHDWCVELYSKHVDQALSQLPEHLHGTALEVAGDIFDYRTVESREQTARWNAQNGYCRHGIALDCCPAGCGSAPDEMPTDLEGPDVAIESDQT